MDSLSSTGLILLIVIFFVTCAVGVVTGSNSLVNVPVMFQFGIDPRVAVATNMFGLTFWSLGGALPFVGKGVFDKKRMPLFIILTLISSALGALLVNLIPSSVFPFVVSVSMIAVVIFTIVYRNAGVHKNENITASAAFLTYFLTFVVGIYGGLFSGGYSTIMTAVFVGLAGMTFTESVANIKLINIFSSAIATVVFAYQGIIDYRLGVILAITMFAAAYFGAKFVVKLSDVWLRRIFLGTVLILALKILLVDILKF